MRNEITRIIKGCWGHPKSRRAANRLESRFARPGLALVLALIAGALLAVPAYADGGTIKGKVVNGTANGGSVEGVEVTLTAYFGQTERNKNSTRTDAQGNFTFTGLDTTSSYSYEATTNYQKGDYSAPRVSFSGAGDTKEVTLKVYDATADESVVKATAKHYVLVPNKGQLEVQEILVLKNDTDRTFTGSREVGPDQRETGRYMPPSGAKNVDYSGDLMSCCVVKQGAAVVDTMAITPGETQKVLLYKLPYSGSSLSFTSTLQQAVEKVQVLVPDTGIRASVAGLAAHGTQSIQGTSYLVFSGEKLPANTNLDVELEGLPVNQFSDSPLVLAGIALGTLGALGAAFYLLRRRSRPAPLPTYGYPAPALKNSKRGPVRDSPTLPATPTALALEQQDLMMSMANLDDWFEAGRIGRKEYERLRAEKKARLVALMRQSGDRRTPVKV